MRIILLGFMGSGKSVFGKKLAKFMNLKFIDLDKHIEQKYRMTIPSIFSTFDETVFRNLETKELDLIFQDDNIVLSCGGGTPCFNNNMDTINQSGISIYLELNEKTLADRLLNSKTKRPLIENLNKDELLTKISELLTLRNPYYKQAQITISSINVKTEEVARLIKDLIVE